MRVIMILAVLMSSLSPLVAAGAEPRTLRLWEGDAPGAVGQEQSEKPTNDVPTITVYTPEKNNGAAIVICPGGGYGGLAQHEAKPVADWANSLGMTGVVLRYRLGAKYKHPAMQHDVNRAIRMVRHHAGEWGIDPRRVGVLGFSAGGHEASTAATHYDTGKQDGDAIDKQSCRPEVAILIYPVITMTDPHTHKGSRNNLLGKDPDAKLIELMSNEKQVTKDTPPTFLVHSSDDKVVPIENSLLFAEALAKHGVPFTLVSFKTGAHGYGMGKPPETIAWPAQCQAWLAGLKFFEPAAK